MLTFYGPRRTTRASWTQEDLDKAIKALKDETISIRKAAKDNNIPERTLRTRIKTGNFIKGMLGKKCHLGEEAEKQLVEHIKKLQSRGFTPSRRNLRKIAFNLSKQMGLKQIFNSEKEIAGRDWYKSFMRRNPTLSFKKPRTLNACTSVMNKEEINSYFTLLNKCLNDNNLMNRPSNIYNMDETDLQLNYEPDLVMTVKDSKNGQAHQCTERGETITVVTCYNAEGSFLPPYCIFKGIKKRKIWEEHMPPGSVIQIRKESAYINEQLFMDWLENHFIPRKSRGPCLLILDDHGSHVNSPDMLQIAADNNIHILCLPSHTTHYLQPLDRSFFKLLKMYYRNACCEWSNANPTKKIGRCHFGLLLAKAWSQAATTQIGISGFKATGIYPFCPSVIPEHAYLETGIAESSSENDDSNTEISVVTRNSLTTQICTTIDENMSQLNPSTQQLVFSSAGPSIKTFQSPDNKNPKTILKEVSPKTTGHVQTSKRNQSATVITSPFIINIERKKQELKKEFIPLLDEDINIEIKEENQHDINECTECFESYYDTWSTENWIQCISCKKWLHETCTMYINTCNTCKRIEFQNAKKLEMKKKKMFQSL